MQKSPNNIFLQALIDEKIKESFKERAATQMTLGALIDVLETMPLMTQVANLKNLRSYRGYYSDLAFVQEEGTQVASELLADCRAAIGRVYEGYKGGDYLMGENTPLWVSGWGECSGLRLIKVNPDGTLKTEREEE